MLTLARLDELAELNDPKLTGRELREYLDTLDELSKANLVALADMKPAVELVAMSKHAPDEGKAVFTRVAAIIRQATDAVGEIKKAAEETDVAAILAKLVDAAEIAPAGEAAEATQTSEPVGVGIQNAEPYTTLYELPVFSLVGDRDVYDTVARMQKGREIKHTVTGGWVVLGAKPSENHYVDDAVVSRMVERHLLIPALGGKPGQEPKAYNLSAVAWRCMGCLYTDQSAKAELQVYSVLGTDKDNPTAKRWRSVLADWRARQARKDTTPGWNRYSEFPLTLGDKITGDGTQTVTVIFDSGDGSGADAFEFYGACLNEKGYFQHTRSKGTVGKTVSQLAYDLAAAEAGRYAEAKKDAARAEAVRAKAAAKQKPAEPPLKILDDGDDAEALAAELGIL